MWQTGHGARAIAFYGITLWSVALFLMAMAFSLLMTAFFNGEWFQYLKSDMPDMWTSQMLNSTGIWSWFLAPVVFIIDLVRWSLYIMFFHFNPIVWVIMVPSIYQIVKAWIHMIIATREDKPAAAAKKQKRFTRYFHEDGTPDYTDYR